MPERTDFTRFTVTVPEEIGRLIASEAERAGVSQSAWVADAAAAKVRNLRLREALAEIDQTLEGGPITEEEIAAATRRWQTPSAAADEQQAS